MGPEVVPAQNKTGDSSDFRVQGQRLRGFQIAVLKAYTPGFLRLYPPCKARFQITGCSG